MAYNITNSGRRSHDRMVLGFTTTSAYHHKRCVSTPFMERCTRYNIMW